MSIKFEKKYFDELANLQINQTQFAAQNTFQIRGFGNGANNPGVEPSVASFKRWCCKS